MKIGTVHTSSQDSQIRYPMYIENGVLGSASTLNITYTISMVDTLHLVSASQCETQIPCTVYVRVS